MRTGLNGWMIALALTAGALGGTADRTWVRVDFGPAAAWKQLPVGRVGGSLPAGWRDDNKYRDVSMTYAPAGEGAERCLRVRMASVNASSVWLTRTQPLPETREITYLRLSYRGRSSNPKSALNMGVFGKRGTRYALSEIPLSPEWTEYTMDLGILPSPEPKFFKISWRSSGARHLAPGTLDLADIVLKPVPRGAFRPVTVRPVPTIHPRYHKTLNAKTREQVKKRGVDIVFFGDSITHHWLREGRPVWERLFVPMKPANLGIGGDRTEHLLWRMQHGALHGLTPRALVLMIGINNVVRWNHSPVDAARGVEDVVAEIRRRLPQTKVLLLTILPTGETPAYWARKKTEPVNRLIAQLHDGERVFFLDVGPIFLDAAGRFPKALTRDFVHLTEKGYEAFARAILPSVKSLLGPDAR